VSASALLEIGFAHSLGKRIIFAEKPEEFILNNLPFEVGLFWINKLFCLQTKISFNFFRT
jgi:hypothetical protein